MNMQVNRRTDEWIEGRFGRMVWIVARRREKYVDKYKVVQI
jgi:hypothetical protein